MEIIQAIQMLNQHPDYRVIERLPIKKQYSPDDGAMKKLAIYLDTETTGFNADEDKVIELAMILFEYGADGTIYRIVDELDQYQDPGFPIPEEITRITGITDKMVEGRNIDLDRVEKMLGEAVVIIAHNAKFDRPFVEVLSPGFKDVCWACSMTDVPWADEELESSKLEYLAYRLGFFYEGHRADIDCYAGIHLLSHLLPKSGRRAFAMLLEEARKSRFKIQAIKAPFDHKDLLKARGYRWEDIAPDQKCWVTTINAESLEEEKAYLEREVYPKDRAQYQVIKVGPRDRFSNRV